ncbi:hypothetical protein KC845_01140 [Candidatus Kaiserbacteria bacterium]|nr:hypothetical protein [Candidatus Kaiserbacteria bacterium]
MEKMILVQIINPSEGRLGELRNICKRFERKEDLHLYFQVAGPYVFIEKIHYNVDTEHFRQELEEAGFVVWIITEPKPAGFHDVIYSRQKNCKDGVDGIETLAIATNILNDGHVVRASKRRARRRG